VGEEASYYGIHPDQFGRVRPPRRPGREVTARV